MRLPGAPEPFGGRRFPVAGSCPSFPAGFSPACSIAALTRPAVYRPPVSACCPLAGFPSAFRPVCFSSVRSRCRCFLCGFPSAFLPLRFPGPLLPARSLLPAGLQLLRSIRPFPFVLFRRAIRREQISSHRAVFMRKFRTFAAGSYEKSVIYWK